MEDSEYIIDLEGVASEEDVQDRIAEALPLPDYYGGNLDALYDVLTEMGDGWHIHFVNIDEDIDEELEPYIEETIQVFEDAAGVVEDMTVDYEDVEYGDYPDID